MHFLIKQKLALALLVSLFVPLFLIAQVSDSESIVVSGTVRDKLNAVMSGVTIQNLRTGVTSLTDANGYYEIAASKGDTLTASHVGYITHRWVFSERIVENITLEAVAGSLEDVVVVGYGQQKKISLVGAQSTVKAEELKHPVANLSTMLSGRIAGLVGVQRSGLPGSNSADIWIRGIQTFGGNASGALVIIDG